MPQLTLDDWQAGRVRGWTFYDCRGPQQSEADYDALAATGANHARVWVQAWWNGSAYVADEDALLRMDECLRRLAARDIQAVVALSIAEQNQPWGDAGKARAFTLLWYTLAQRWAGNTAVTAFDLLNEPIPGPAVGGAYTAAQFAQIAAEWPALALLTVQTLRIADPSRLVVYQVGLGADPSQFTGQPLAAEGVIYSFHMYHPHSVTHQGTAERNAGVSFNVPLTYDDARSTLMASLAAVAQNFKGLPRYAGEFGCCNWVTGHWRYLSDVTDWCAANNMCWAVHSFRSWWGWDYEAIPDGLRNDYMRSPDTTAMRLLSAAMRGQAPSAPAEPPATTPEPAPMPIPDPLPATPAPLVAPSAPPADFTAYVQMLSRLVEVQAKVVDQQVAEARAAQDRFDMMYRRAQDSDDARNAVLRGSKRDVAAEWMAHALARQTDTSVVEMLLPKYMALLDRLYPEA